MFNKSSAGIIAAEHPVFRGHTANQVEERARERRNTPLAGVGGFCSTKDGPRLAYAPQKLLLAETAFYFVRGAKWEPDPLTALPNFSLRLDHKEGNIVPLTGGLYIKNRRLSDQELETLGLTPVRNNKGEKITFPYFCVWGTRVLSDPHHNFFPVYGAIKDLGKQFSLARIEDEPFIPKSMKDLELYISSFLNETGQNTTTTLASLEQQLENIWQNIPTDEEKIAWPIFSERFRWPAFARMMLRHFAPLGHAALYTGCCLQFKGAGANYVGHAVKPGQDGRLPLLPGEAVMPFYQADEWRGKEMVMVGYPNLFEKFGLFLDQFHQPPPATADPVGGMIEADTEAIDRDRQLLASGAEVGGISLSRIRLLDQTAIRKFLPDYDSGDLFVLARAVGNDTRRLAFLENAASYQLFIRDSFPEESFDAGREKHLANLAANLGKNIRAVLDCRLTCKFPLVDGHFKRPNTSNNLSPEGAIFDSTELIPADKLGDAGAIIACWLEDFFKVTEAAGLNQNNFGGNFELLGTIMENIFKAKGEFPEETQKTLAALTRREQIYSLSSTIINSYMTWR
ncbi:MAG: hypothetical protein WCW67_04255 [Candidatus Margulisiibacteriota bacterium]|jgi:hypothetical protein